jgi:hypothetical protein
MRGKGVYRRVGEVQRDERTAFEGEVEERGRVMTPGREGISGTLFQIAASPGHLHSLSLSPTLRHIAIHTVT